MLKRIEIPIIFALHDLTQRDAAALMPIDYAVMASESARQHYPPMTALLAEIDALAKRMHDWSSSAPPWRPAEVCQATIGRLGSRLPMISISCLRRGDMKLLILASIRSKRISDGIFFMSEGLLRWRGVLLFGRGKVESQPCRPT
jgi:hypothetical protein